MDKTDKRLRSAKLGYRKMKADGTQLATLQALCPEETMSHVVFEGQPMTRDAFFEWIRVGDASTAIARLRYRQEPVSDHPHK